MKMTDGQRLWLKDSVAGRDPMNRFYGAASHGGATTIRASLHRRGWIDVTGEVTDAGRQALKDNPGPSAKDVARKIWEQTIGKRIGAAPPPTEGDMSTTTKTESRKPPRRLWTFTFTYPGGKGYYGMLFHKRAAATTAMNAPGQYPEWTNRRLVSWTMDKR